MPTVAELAKQYTACVWDDGAPFPPWAESLQKAVGYGDGRIRLLVRAADRIADEGRTGPPTDDELVAWLTGNTAARLALCDAAMCEPGAEPESTADVLALGYRREQAEVEQAVREFLGKLATTDGPESDE